MRAAVVLALLLLAGAAGSSAEITGQIGTGSSGIFDGGPELGLTGSALGINGGGGGGGCNGAIVLTGCTQAMLGGL